MDDPDFVAESLALFRLLLGGGDLAEDEREVFRRVAWYRFGITAGEFNPLEEELAGLADDSVSLRVVEGFRALPQARRLALARETIAIADTHPDLKPYRERILLRVADLLDIVPDQDQGAA